MLLILLLRQAPVMAAMMAPSPAARVEVHLLGVSGEPLAGARVAVVGRQGTLLSDSSGVVIVEPVPEVPFTLLVARPDGVAVAPVTVTHVPDDGTIELTVGSGLAESVEVLSSAVPDLELAPASGFTLVGRGELEQKVPQSLAQTVESVPGGWRSGDGRDAVPSLRGLAGGRTILLLDEGRVAAERRAGPSATFLDPDSIDEVEIIRGPGTVAYGSDAFGGIIRARTYVPSAGEPLAVRVGLGLGTGRNERSAAATVSGTVAGGGLLVGANRRYSAGYDSPLGGVANSSYSTGGARLGYQRLYLGGNLRILWRRDQASNVGKAKAGDGSSRTYYPEERSDRVSVQFDRAGPGSWSRLGLSLSWDRYRIVTARARLTGETGSGEESEVRAQDYGVRLEAERPAGAGRLLVGLDVNGRLGLHAVNRTFQISDGGDREPVQQDIAVEDGRRDDVGAFLTCSQEWGSWGAAVGVRGDLVSSENRGGFFGDRSTSRSHLSGFIALTARPGQGWEATVQVARGFRDALVSDRYFRGITGRGTIMGNPDLAPETSRQLDIATRFSSEGFQLAAFTYLYRIDGLIERYRQGDEYRFRNRGEAEVLGLELEGSWALGGLARLEVGAQLLRAEVREDGQPLDGIPPRGARITLRGGERERWTWFAMVAAHALDDRPGPTEREVGGWTVVDAGVMLSVGNGVRLHFQGRNLLEREYWGSADEDAPLSPGRVLEARLRWDM